jgi:hypothetical protein
MSPEAMAVRLRIYDDFAFASEAVLKVRTKKGTVSPLILNRPQRILRDAIDRQMEETGMVRIIVLKARQQGLSTAIGAWLYLRTIQNRAKKTLVVAHKADSTRALFDMTKRYYQNTPDFLKPATQYNSGKLLSFNRLDSSYMVATAGGEGIARGETITDAHLSELAFWPAGSRDENFAGLMQAIPDEQGTSIFIESTANGISGLFYETWKGAVDGTNGFTPVFIPWFITEEYARPLPKSRPERTPEEHDIAERALRDWGVEITDEQFEFRRVRIRQTGLDMFRQEYPATAEEAFLTSGRPVFEPEQITGLLHDAPEPIERLAVSGDKWIEDRRGELRVYQPLDESATYYIGADVAMGLRGPSEDVARVRGGDPDWSVAQVLNGKGEQVAMWRGRVKPYFYAEVLAKLGRRFNDARIIVESNNHGLSTLDRLYHELRYPNLYTQVSIDKTTELETVTLGFNTNAKSKPLIINQLRADMMEGRCKPVDATTLREMQTYIVTEEGKMEAEQGCHDDCVMALALANFIQEGDYEPIEFHDDWYASEEPTEKRSRPHSAPDDWDDE